jgi:hypothetical protein
MPAASGVDQEQPGVGGHGRHIPFLTVWLPATRPSMTTPRGVHVLTRLTTRIALRSSAGCRSWLVPPYGWGRLAPNYRHMPLLYLGAYARIVGSARAAESVPVKWHRRACQPMKWAANRSPKLSAPPARPDGPAVSSLEPARCRIGAHAPGAVTRSCGLHQIGTGIGSASAT